MSNNLLKKRGQVHISETMLVMFVVVVIILLLIVIYFRFAAERNKQLPDELSERQATILLTQTVALPEFACATDDCIDTAKFLPFQQILGEHNVHYKQVFGAKSVTFTQLYPPPPTTSVGVECDIAHYIQVDYPNNCDTWTVYDYNPENKPGAVVSTIVALYFPEIDIYRVGRLSIAHYGSIAI